MKKSSEDWYRMLKDINNDILLLDADGWDRKNFEESWSELITLEEFERRFSRSTVQFQSVTDVMGAFNNMNSSTSSYERVLSEAETTPFL